MLIVIILIIVNIQVIYMHAFLDVITMSISIFYHVQRSSSLKCP